MRAESGFDRRGLFARSDLVLALLGALTMAIAGWARLSILGYNPEAPRH